MVLWGPVEARCTDAKMVFEVKSTPNVYKYEIPKVWVQFRGLPEELLEFPIVWAIGSILGVTRNVDMKFVKKHEMGRLLVAVLDPELVPDLVDIVIGDFVYELQFRVESEENGSIPQPIDMDIDQDPNIEEKDKNEDGEAEKENNTESKQSHDGAKSLHQTTTTSTKNGQHTNSVNNSVHSEGSGKNRRHGDASANWSRRKWKLDGNAYWPSFKSKERSRTECCFSNSRKNWTEKSS